MAEGTEVSAKEKRIDWLVVLERYALILAWIALIVIFAVAAPPSFLQWPTFSSIIFGSQAVSSRADLGPDNPAHGG